MAWKEKQSGYIVAVCFSFLKRNYPTLMSRSVSFFCSARGETRSRARAHTPPSSLVLSVFARAPGPFFSPLFLYSLFIPFLRLSSAPGRVEDEAWILSVSFKKCFLIFKLQCVWVYANMYLCACVCVCVSRASSWNGSARRFRIKRQKAWPLQKKKKRHTRSKTKKGRKEERNPPGIRQDEQRLEGVPSVCIQDQRRILFHPFFSFFLFFCLFRPFSFPSMQIETERERPHCSHSSLNAPVCLLDQKKWNKK